MVSNIHFPLVELFDSEGSSKGVGQIFPFIDLHKIDVASSHDLLYEVAVPQNMLGGETLVPQLEQWL